MIILYEGTEQEFWAKFREEVQNVIDANDSKKVSPLSKVEACSQLGISFPTLQRVCKEMNLSDIYPSDINRIFLKYPKYIKRAGSNNRP